MAQKARQSRPGFGHIGRPEVIKIDRSGPNFGHEGDRLFRGLGVPGVTRCQKPRRTPKSLPQTAAESLVQPKLPNRSKADEADLPCRTSSCPSEDGQASSPPRRRTTKHLVRILQCCTILIFTICKCETRPNLTVKPLRCELQLRVRLLRLFLQVCLHAGARGCMRVGPGGPP